MSLIPPEFVNLADPPSLESCTRDIYASDIGFSFRKVLKMASQLASVAEHLHSRGLIHGDLYGHNILYNERGDCLLGDFGAASFVPQGDSFTAEAFQRIEVRAFACLLEELLDRCEFSSVEQGAIDTLRLLQRRCEQSQVEARPLFAEINQLLRSLNAVEPVI